MKLTILFFFLTIQFAFSQIKVGAECTEDYLPQIRNKNIAIVANQTSVIHGVHLVDTLLKQQIRIKKIFTPEHGFRGIADAGEHVNDSIDSKTKLPLVSLYGSHKKPTKEDLQGIDIVIFDIQDVGARFYTYISTMHYVMEACAENNVEFLILDRPNPNGFYVDGPVLDTAYSSFVGMHPVPIVHGMTIAEYARMINDEGWLTNGVHCNLHYVLCDGYNHAMKYTIPISPSPNLSSMQAIYLYPALCLTEGTVLSCGRGTPFPFQVIGHPQFKDTSFSFIPKSIEGASKNPPFKNQICYGRDLRKYNMKDFSQIPLEIIIDAYKNYTGTEPFFNSFFIKLAGTPELQKQIEQGLDANAIRQSWQPQITEFKKIRKKYVLYTN